jgi:hypothetical protein
MLVSPTRGEISFVDPSNVGEFNYFQPTTSYVGRVVGNASTNGGMIAITGAPGITDTVNLSTAVTGIVFSEVSLGQPGVATQYTFDQGLVSKPAARMPSSAAAASRIVATRCSVMSPTEPSSSPAAPLLRSPLPPKIRSFGTASPLALSKDLPLRLLSRSLTLWLWLVRAFWV